jgi:hypothetical protein
MKKQHVIQAKTTLSQPTETSSTVTNSNTPLATSKTLPAPNTEASEQWVPEVTGIVFEMT